MIAVGILIWTTFVRLHAQTNMTAEQSRPTLYNAMEVQKHSPKPRSSSALLSSMETSDSEGKDESDDPHPMGLQIPPTYQLIDIGAFRKTDQYIEVHGINANGVVVGETMDLDNIVRGFVYSGTTPTKIGLFPGTTGSGSFSSAGGINSLGQIVGTSSVTNANNIHAFLLSNGNWKDLGSLGNSSGATAINSSGQIVGSTATNNNGLGYSHAFLYSNGIMQDLGTFGRNCYAYAINDAGQIVGYSEMPNGYAHAFLYADGIMQDLHTDGGFQSYAFGINNHSQVVGYRHTLSGDLAYVYRNGSYQIIATNASAHAINDNGQILGGSNNIPMLFMNGSSYVLSNLVIMPPGWALWIAAAINNNGQIAGSMINLTNDQEHAVLLNPVDPNSLPTLQVGISHPPYGAGITQQPGKTNLIVITHGRIRPGQSPTAETSWIDHMSNSITTYLTTHNVGGWQVVAHKWIDGAQGYSDYNPLDYYRILGNAKMDGKHLANSIVAAGNWKHFHLIAHSAGSEVIQACSEVIRNHYGNACTIHCTFLDPFTGPIPSLGILNNSLLNNVSVYGNKADWADDYFTIDGGSLDNLGTGGNTWPVTQGRLNHAYSVNVTYLDDDHTRQLYGYSHTSLFDNTPCKKTESIHDWPIQFYSNTITGTVKSGYQNFGFPISEEAEKWFLASDLIVGNNPLTLGTPDPDCVPLYSDNTGTSSSNPLNFSSPGASETQIEEGLIQNVNAGLFMHDDVPAWLARFMALTNSVNYVAFDAQFVSDPPGGGQFSVYWDSSAIGFSDETLVGTNAGHYVFSFPPAVQNSSHMLGFRLDAPTNAPSTISITNVILGFIGVSEPFSLLLPTNTFNGLPIFQLSGQPGFNYKVQASTNLINWMDMAILVNTNGLVPFIDPDSTNYACRFYRVVAPY